MLIYNGIGLLFVYQDMEKKRGFIKTGISGGISIHGLTVYLRGSRHFSFHCSRSSLGSYTFNLGDYYPHLFPHEMRSSLTSSNLYAR